MENDSRRKFLGVCLTGAAVAAAAAAAYPVYRYLAPKAETVGGAEKVVFAETDIPEGEAKFLQYAGSSAVVVRSKGKLLALSAVCTHLGCIVQWEKDKQEFLCPCHAGRYSADGVVLSGPPPKPLPTIPVSQSEGKIIVG